MKNKRFFTSTKGLSLVEMLVTTGLLVGGILAFITFVLSLSHTMQISRDKVVALNHAETVLEEMRSDNYPALSDITSENWTVFDPSLGAGLLPNETISVVYANSSADPLNVTVTIAWTSANRNLDVSLETEITKY